MSIEIVEESGTVMADGLFLPPTVRAVKQLAHSKLLLTAGIVLFVALSVWSLCDFSVGVAALPLGILIFISHIITFIKAKSGRNAFGLRLLGFCYLLPVAVYYILRLLCLVLDGKYITPFFEKLKAVDFKLPQPLEKIVNCSPLSPEWVLIALMLMAIALSYTLIMLLSSQRKNTPGCAVAVISAVVALAAVGFFGFFGGEMLYDILNDVFFTTTAADFKISAVTGAATLLLLAVYSALMLGFFIKIIVKMKRIKNVIQK